LRLSSASEGAAQLRRHRRGGTSYKRCDQLTNSTWSFTIEELRRVTGLDDILVFNDFQALAWSLPHLRREELHRIGESESLPHATKVVLGPGTGIGVAGLVWSGTEWTAVPSEGGHISLAAHTQREFELIERMRGDRDHLSADRVLSGPGLATLYQAIAESEGRRVEPLPPNEVLTLGWRPATRSPLRQSVSVEAGRM
jgi:glucokinase